MATVGLRELSRETRKVIEELEESREPVLIVRRGEPIAALITVDAENANEMLLASLPEFVAERERADKELEAGRTRPLSDVMAEIEAEEGAGGAEEELEEADRVEDLVAAWRERLASPEFGPPIAEAIGAEFEPAEVERIGALNRELFESLAVSACVGAVQQLQSVNANLVKSLSRQGKLSGTRFRAALEQVTEVERLARPVTVSFASGITVADFGASKVFGGEGKEPAGEEEPTAYEDSVSEEAD